MSWLKKVVDSLGRRRSQAEQRLSPVQALFEVGAEAGWGDQIVLVGNRPELGAWDPTRGIPLSGNRYPRWSVSLALPPASRVEYKYVRRQTNGATRWEEGTNRSLQLPADGGTLARCEQFRE